MEIGLVHDTVHAPGSVVLHVVVLFGSAAGHACYVSLENSEMTTGYGDVTCNMMR